MQWSGNRRRRTLVSLCLGGLVVAGAIDRTSHAQTPSALLYGVTPSNRLVAFSSTAPGQLLNSVAIANLAPGERILGIDVRPATKQLYALGSSSQLYPSTRSRVVRSALGGTLSPALARHQLRIRLQSHGRSHSRRQRCGTESPACIPIPAQWSPLMARSRMAPGDSNQGRAPAASGAGVHESRYGPVDGHHAGRPRHRAWRRRRAESAERRPAEYVDVNPGAAAVSVGFDIGLTDFYAAVPGAGRNDRPRSWR